MKIKPLKFYLDKARKEHWAIGQFNFSDFSEVKGIVQAAQNQRAPIILGTSEGESKFFGLQEAVALRDVLRKKTGLPIFLNLDHGRSFEYLQQAMLAGYDMVHFDGSKLPLEENIKISKQVLAFAKSRLLWGLGGQREVVVEGEVGHFSTDASIIYQDNFQIKEEDLTSVKDAQEYYKKAKVNVLAVNIGTFHGIDANIISPALRLDRLKELQEKVGVPMVLHGGSGTPQGDLKAAVGLGIVKVNINTELRMAFTKALRETLAKNQSEITPYKFLPDAVDAVKWVTESNIKLFDSENKA